MVHFYVFVLFHSDPIFQQAMRSPSDKEKRATSQVYNLWFGSEGPTQSHRPSALLVSVRTHASCQNEGWMLSTVLECIGTGGGAGMPALSVCLSFSDPTAFLAFFFLITNRGQSVSKQIRS